MDRLLLLETYIADVRIILVVEVMSRLPHLMLLTPSLALRVVVALLMRILTVKLQHQTG